MDRSRRIPRSSNLCREDGQCSSPPPSHRWILLRLPQCKCCKDWSQQSTTSSRTNKFTHLTRRHHHHHHPNPSFETFPALNLPPSLMLWSHSMPMTGCRTLRASCRYPSVVDERVSST